MLAVVGYHFRVWKLSNGYLGVDIFFVISGYLITLSLLSHGGGGTLHDLAGFYARRVRRILPAATTMTVACLIVAIILCFPVEVADIGRSATFAALFLANVHFGQQVDYFARWMESVPLIHMWSLSVEEQFYLLFPVILLALRGRKPIVTIAVLGLLALASLTAAMLAAPQDGNAVFYFVQYRAWELLLGALVALGAVPAIGGKRAAAAVAIGGLLLIAGGLVQAHRLTILGSAALLPCIGTAVALHAGSRVTSLPSRLLGLPPLRFIGRISYSLYLWHWPLLVFYRLHREPGRLESAALIAASIGLATLSWRFVEQPFRTRPYRLGTAATLIAGAGAIAGTALLGLAAAPIATRIHPTDALTAHILAASLHSPSDWRSGICFVMSGRTSAAFDRARCLPISLTRPNVLIVGDSHAAHFVPGFMAAYPQVNFQQATSLGCRPLLHPTGRPWCVDLMRRTFGAFVDRPRLDAVILSARWRLTDVPRVAETIAAIGHRVPHVYVLGPIVEYNASLPRILAAAPRGREEEDAARHRLTEQRAIDRALASAVAGTGAVYISTYRTICPPGAPCRLWSSPGTPLQFDYGHLTVEGATVIARAFAPALDFARTGTDKAAIRTAGPDLSIQTATNPH